MKRLMFHCGAICFCLLVFCTSIARAQDTQANRSSHEYYTNYYSGCWQTNNTSDGYLVTKADGTFQWIKPTDKNDAPADTLHGRWHTKGAISFPKKTDVIVMKFSNGKRKRYEIGLTSFPAVIYLPGDDFHKVPCK